MGATKRPAQTPVHPFHELVQRAVEEIQFLKSGRDRDPFYDDKVKSSQRRLRSVYEELERVAPRFAGLHVIQPFLPAGRWSIGISFCGTPLCQLCHIDCMTMSA